MDNHIEIRPARDSEHDEPMAAIMASVRSSNPDLPSLARMYWDLYLPGEEEMSCVPTARCDDKIVGCVGAFPIAVTIGWQVVEILLDQQKATAGSPLLAPCPSIFPRCIMYSGLVTMARNL